MSITLSLPIEMVDTIDQKRDAFYNLRSYNQLERCKLFFAGSMVFLSQETGKVLGSCKPLSIWGTPLDIASNVLNTATSSRIEEENRRIYVIRREEKKGE